MCKTDANKLHRISRGLIAACAAALLVTTPLAASAQWQAPPVQAAPQDEPVRGDETRPAVDKSDAVHWEDFSVEVYGKLVSRSGKVATLLPLVATTTTPVAAGTKAVLFQKVEDPTGQKTMKWVEIAKVTMKKIEATGNMQLTIDAEAQPSVPRGKGSSFFVKGARLKLAIE